MRSLLKRVLTCARSLDACNGAQWFYGPWSACSAACGGTGAANRTAFCVPSPGASPGACDLGAGVPLPFLQRSCAPAACSLALWRAGPWGACTAACGGARACPLHLCQDATASDGAALAAVMSSSRVEVPVPNSCTCNGVDAGDLVWAGDTERHC